MKILLLILLTSGGYLSWQVGLLQAVTGLGDVSAEPSTVEDRIASELVTSRQAVGVTPLVCDAELQKWLQTSDKARATDPEAIAQSVREAWPQYQDVRVIHTYSLFESSLMDRIAEWPEAGAAELTHLSVAVQPGLLGIGRSATVLAGVRLPLFRPEALDDPNQSDFYSVCSVCQHSQPCRIPREAHLFKLRCQHCHKLYAMLAADTQGRYHYVTDFLSGYLPPNTILPAPNKLDELMAIWQGETQFCRYLTDGHKETDEEWQTAKETTVLRRGDCEDSALLLADWLIARRYQARVAIGTYGPNHAAHAWVVVRVDGNEFVLESTESPFGLQRPPTATEIGTRYVPEVLFDRDAIYTPKEHAPSGTHTNYWSDEAWDRVETEGPRAES